MGVSARQAALIDCGFLDNGSCAASVAAYGLFAKLFLAPAVGIAVFAALPPGSILTSTCFIPWSEPHYSQRTSGHRSNDMVIAVSLGGESRAYPIREMGYHHVVNDRLHQTADCCYVLNALPHGSGLDPQPERTRTALSPGGHQQPELPDAR